MYLPLTTTFSLQTDLWLPLNYRIFPPESQSPSGWKGPEEVLTLISCSRQGQQWAQTRLLGDVSRWVWKISKDGSCTNPLFCCLAVLREKKFFAPGWPSSAQINKLSLTPPRNILDGLSLATLPFELFLQIEGQPCSLFSLLTFPEECVFLSITACQLCKASHHICYSNHAAVLWLHVDL